jgi:tetratricopeptide (TPR) repeat protein
LEKATQQDPQSFWAWFIQGICYANLAQDTKAEACYTACIALWPKYPWSYFNRGLVYLRQRDYARAGADFDQAIALRPDHAEPYINRALALQGRGQYEEASADLTHALDLGAPYSRIYFMRARVREKAGEVEGAKTDREEGLRREPTDESSWIARGLARLTQDAEGALADFNQALKLNPRSLGALQDKAYVLAERLGRPREALQTLDRAVMLYPDFIAARSGRGLLQARLGRRQAAVADAEETLRRDTTPPILYQVAAIYALTSRTRADDRLKALQLLSAALGNGFGADRVETDKDLDALRDDPEFRRLVSGTRALAAVVPQSAVSDSDRK